VRHLSIAICTLTFAIALTACSDDRRANDTEAPENRARAPYESSYERLPWPPTLIRNATILTGTGEKIENGAILLRDGRIAAIGTAIDAPEDAEIIDASGKWLTPGLIDIHSHLGVYPAPGDRAHADGNEIVNPNTAHVWAEHSVWPQDPGFSRALAGGVTSLMILPGSANLFGGRSVTLKNVPARTVQAMKFPGAPYGLKMACGENPKRVYGSRNQAPYTRMGNVAGYRAAWIEAQAYADRWRRHEKKLENGQDADPPTRDLRMETLAGVLNGEILVQNHCYRADEMAIMIDIAREFDYRITAFHHAVESYKIADLLAENDICSAMWTDWWGFKLEAYDMVPENIALVDAAGACAILHSDSPVDIQRLNQEAAKAMAHGNRIGLGITPEVAIKWITANPAKAMGILDQTGTLEEGKMADVVLWNGNPFSVYTLAERVYVDGALMFDRNDPERSPRSDFEIGQHGNTRTGGAGQ
jgi:imidazolonepropionase-like amidohydrolase